MILCYVLKKYGGQIKYGEHILFLFFLKITKNKKKILNLENKSKVGQKLMNVRYITLTQWLSID